MDMAQTGRVVVGLRSSPAGYSALRYAVAEARRRGLALLVVRAFGRTALGTASEATLVREAVTELGTAFAEALGALPGDLTVQLLTHAAEPGPCLIAAADRDADLLVLGGSGRRRFLGRGRARIAAYCASHATCPVVIVPPPALSRSAGPRRLERAAAECAEGFLPVTGARPARDRAEGVS